MSTKQFIYILSVIIMGITGSARAQQVTQPVAAVEKMLCKKWTISYATMQGMRIGQMPGNQQMEFEFFKDRTFKTSGNLSSKKGQGTWVYDLKQHCISMAVKGGERLKVSSLKTNEMILAVDLPKSPSMPASNGMTQLQLVCKPK